MRHNIGWIDSQVEPPPRDKKVWAFDMFHNNTHMAFYDGDKCDDGTPFLTSLTERGDDYYLRLWQPLEVPKPPTKAELKELTEIL